MTDSETEGRDGGLELEGAYPGVSPRASATSLADLVEEGAFSPTAINALADLPLRAICNEGEETVVGALVPHSELARNPLITSQFPAIAQALLSDASRPLGEVATTGGSLLPETRCPYFGNVTARCNRRNPGSGCDAILGFNRCHAILGGSEHCIATHPSDFAVALTAFDARVRVMSPQGGREIRMTDLYLEPYNTPQKEHTLRHGELIVAVVLPRSPVVRRSLYLKVADRRSPAFALASAAVVANIDSGVFRRVRIGLGGVGTVPWRAVLAERRLEGRPPSEALFREAADDELAEAHPVRHNAFKVPLAKQTLVSALGQLADEPGEVREIVNAV